MLGKISPGNPLVSVIVPCYNYGKYLSDTLNSVLQQTYSNWECIVVDDGSTDNTREVAASFSRRDSRFKYFYQGNAGLSAARNTGLYNSGGQYIQLLDADDKIEPEKLQSQVTYLQAHQEVDILYGEVRYFMNENTSLMYSLNGSDQEWIAQLSGKSKKNLNLLIRNNIMAVNCALIKKTLFHTIGYFDEQLRSLEDWDFWIRCAMGNCYFQYYKGPENSFALVRTHAESLSRQHANMKMFHLQLLDKHLKSWKLGIIPCLVAITKYSEIYLDSVREKKIPPEQAPGMPGTFDSSLNTVSYFLFPVYFIVKGYRKFLQKKH